MGRANEIMNAMSLKKAKNSQYPDATPAVQLALANVRKECAESSASLAERIGADEETQETLNSMCVKNVAMLTPVLNSSYFVRKEVMGWDCKV